MSWEIEHLEADGIVRVKARGDIHTEDAWVQAEHVSGLLQAHKLKGVLADYTAANLEMPVTDIYKLPELLDTLEFPRTARIAIVLPVDPEHVLKYTFFDDVATNRGYTVRLFEKPAEATAWLIAGFH